MPDSSIIYIALGQAGVQESNAAWELFCLEHGVDPEGKMISEVKESDDRMGVFFYQGSAGGYVPRAIMIDLEPTVIDEVRQGVYRDLHNPDMLITSYEDAAGNYARGYFTKGRLVVDRCVEAVRKQVLHADSLQGFIITNGLGGGTGAGLATLLMERLGTEFGKHSKIMMNVFPGPSLSTSIVEPYNVALSTHSCIEFTDVNITLDNEAVYRLCAERLQCPRPTYNNVNRLMAQVSSAVTCSLRYDSTLNADLHQLQTNLVPYPRIHFPVVSYAPIICRQNASHDRLTTRQTVRDLFESSGRMVSCDTTLGKFIACNLQFRGCVSPSEMNAAIQQIKRNHFIEFVDWCPTGFKIGISGRPPMCIPDSNMANTNMNCTMLANTTSIGTVWRKLKNKFDLMYEKRAFMHWYVSEGMEEGEMEEARTELKEIIADYSDLSLEVDGENEEKEEDKQEQTEEQQQHMQSEEQEPEMALPNFDSYQDQGQDTNQYQDQYLDQGQDQGQYQSEGEDQGEDQGQEDQDQDQDGGFSEE